MNEEFVVLVDEQDQQLGVEEKIAAHREGKLHRAFSVFILRKNLVGNIEILLQQRAANKYHCGNLWTNTCCSHPRFGEEITAAAGRRLREEVGISTKLYTVGNFCYRAEFNNGLIEHELDHTFVGVYQKAAEDIQFNQQEVQALKWLELKQLEQELINNVAAYTPWLQQALLLVVQQQKFINALLEGRDNPEEWLWID